MGTIKLTVKWKDCDNPFVYICKSVSFRDNRVALDHGIHGTLSLKRMQWCRCDEIEEESSEAGMI